MYKSGNICIKSKICRSMLILFLVSMLFSMKVKAENELQGIEDNIVEDYVTAIDEDGNIIEIEPETGWINSDSQSSTVKTVEAKVVNFNVKGNVTTSYIDVVTGQKGYTCGAYGADAAYLGMVSGKVRFMLSGVMGEVSADQVQIVNLEDTASISHYTVKNGRLIHRITVNLTDSAYFSSIDNGPAPDYMTEGGIYYSYDGHFFYTYDNFSNMIVDYNGGRRDYAVNMKSPYYNYFQYLPLRSKSNYSVASLDNLINAKTSENSKMRGIGKAVIDTQNIYGVNALLMTGIAANESAWGKSNIAQKKNNLFGLNAVDSSPGQSANYYDDVSSCIKEFGETYMSKRYLRPGYTYYHGGFLGNKASGINVSYASDPYWGEKAAAVAWSMDREAGLKDSFNYTIGIKGLINENIVLNLRRDASTSSGITYKTVSNPQYSVLVLNNGNQSEDFYRIQSDPVLTSERTTIDSESGQYDFDAMYVYASSNYISIVQSGILKQPEEGEDTVTWESAEKVEVPAEVENIVKSSAHVSNLGWIREVGNGEQVGTCGIGHPMEALRISVDNRYGIGIEYCAHVSNVGWQSYVSGGQMAGTTGEKRAVEAVKIHLTGKNADEYTVLYRAHVSGIGWQSYVTDDEIAGTTGQGRAIEAIQLAIIKKERNVDGVDSGWVSTSTFNDTFGWIEHKSGNGKQSGTVGMASSMEKMKVHSNVDGVAIQYAIHVPDEGWKDYVQDNIEVTGGGQPIRMEALKFKISGRNENVYDIFYRVHSANYGWLGWAKNGEPAGTKGYSCAIEAYQIVLVEKGSWKPDKEGQAFIEKETNIVYSAFVNGKGWQESVCDGTDAGTTGQSKAIGALKVSLDNKSCDGSIQYMAHMQNDGWGMWIEEGRTVGADNNKNLRLEAIKIQLTGDISKVYDVYYRVHVQNEGWLGWSKNGNSAGTEGYSYRIEAIQIRLVKKGEASPGSMKNSYKRKLATLSYSSHVQNIGWQSFVSDGVVSGTIGNALRVEAVRLKLSDMKYGGHIQYSTHIQNIGWQPFVSDGRVSGTTGKGLRMEAIKIKLSGEISDYCDIYYRVHIQDKGWLGWTKNGEPAGSQGHGKRLEAMEVKLVPKGESDLSLAGLSFYQ